MPPRRLSGATGEQLVMMTPASPPLLPGLHFWTGIGRARRAAWDQPQPPAPRPPLLCRSRFLQGPDTDPAAVAELRAAVEAGSPCTVRLLNYRRDGSTFWNLLSLTPLRVRRRRAEGTLRTLRMTKHRMLPAGTGAGTGLDAVPQKRTGAAALSALSLPCCCARCARRTRRGAW